MLQMKARGIEKPFPECSGGVFFTTSLILYSIRKLYAIYVSFLLFRKICLGYIPKI